VGGEGGGPLIDEDDACATGAVVGETVPVTMFLVFDKSGSMLDDQKWAGAKAALTAFFQDDESAGLRVALRFFPDDAPVPGCDEQACSVDACAVPLVDVGELTPAPASSDPQQKALVEAIDAVTPSGETPMFPALAGAAKWATEHATPGEKMVVVLVTDGEPNGCNEDMDAIAGVAADALASAGVLTYAIGMSGSSPEQMNQLAVAGGTGASLVIGGGSVHTALLAALSDIKTAELSCTLALPSPEVAGAERRRRHGRPPRRATSRAARGLHAVPTSSRSRSAATRRGPSRSTPASPKKRTTWSPGLRLANRRIFDRSLRTARLRHGHHRSSARHVQRRARTG
jgi:hypothetical protein